MSDKVHEFLTNFDTIILTVLALSLVQIHLLLGIIVLVPVGIYNYFKLFDYFKNRKNKKQHEKTDTFI